MAEADPISLHHSFEDARVAEVVDQSHRLRSKCLDAFARLETEVFALAAHLGTKPDTSSPIGHRIAAFRAVTIADKKRKARLDGLLDELAQMASFRANIVHAAIRPILDLVDKTVLIQFLAVPVEKGISLTLAMDEMKTLPGKVAHLANRFKQFRTTPAPAAPAVTSATA